MSKKDKSAQYEPIIAHIFKDHWRKNVAQIEFSREELVAAAESLKVDRPKNLGDLIYSFKFRRELPDSIQSTAPKGKCWLLEGAGHAMYRFRLVDIGGRTIVPREDIAAILIPDSTPEIISSYALGDEQAVLAKVRYNRLIDIFLGLTTYSLQNHLRTQVQKMGQIEIDEVYVGLNRHGAQFVIPVQAKGGTDKLSPVQTAQDMACCASKFPGLVCRPVSVQFMDENVIALFELTQQEDRVLIVEEKHYRLVKNDEIDGDTRRQYVERS